MGKRRGCWGAFSILLFSLLGCGGNNLASVNGTASYGGEPISDGEIRFIPQNDTGDGPGMSGAKIIDGSYSVPADKGVAPGPVRVEIRATKKTGKKIEAVPPAPPNSEIDETIQYIPRDYNTATTLTAEIKPGDNELNFDLEKIE